MSDNVNPLDMSDEEFLNANPSPEGLVPEEEQETKTPEPEQSETENTPSESELTDTDNSNGSSEQLTEQEKSTNIQSKEPVEEEQPQVNYEDFYKQVMAPFKGNGKTITLKNAEEAIHLMQQGVNYTQKMQQIGPYRKALMMLEKNGLLDENQLSFLIDVKNKNPEAIKKFLKDNNIDPLDIDTTQEPNYKAGTNIVSDAEVNFKSALDEMTSTPEGLQALRTINDTWDTQSKDSLMQDPSQLKDIQLQMANGTYDLITKEMDRQKALGQISPNTPFLKAYMDIGYRMLAQKNQQQPIQAPRAVRPATVNTLSNGNKIRQAGISSNSSKQPRKSGNMINPLAMSDEDFEKQFGNRYY